MTLEELERLAQDNLMANRHGYCFPTHLARKLIVVAKAANELDMNHHDRDCRHRPCSCGLSDVFVAIRELENI